MHKSIGTYSSVDISPEMILYKRRGGTPDEILFPLLCRGILNFSELIRDKDNEVYSVASPLNMGDERLSLNQILADICLTEILSGDGWDRMVIPVSTDMRNKHSEMITGNNCRIYHNGTYSVFDFDSIEFRELSDKEILYDFYISLSRLYGLYGVAGSAHLSYIMSLQKKTSEKESDTKHDYFSIATIMMNEKNFFLDKLHMPTQTIEGLYQRR